MPRLIAVTSDKGGVGKSTLAMHLAGAWAAVGARVGLIDEDERIGSCLRWAARNGRQGAPPLGFPVWAESEVKKGRLNRYDLILIDTAGRPKRRELRRIADDADVMLLPSGVSALELEATLDAARYLQDHAQDVRAVLTRVPPLGRAGEMARDTLSRAGVPVCRSVVRSYTAYARAAETGALVRDLKGASARSAWADVQALAAELA